MFDATGRILLVHWRDPATAREFLEPPGGLREPGESFEESLRREIAEETGLAGIEVGELVAEIDHAFTFDGEPYDCRERYFVCHVGSAFPVATSRGHVERAGIVGVEWASVDDLAARPPGYVEPPQLVDMLRRLRR